MEYLGELKSLFDNYVVNKFHKLVGLFVVLFITFWLLLSVHSSVRSDFDYEWYLYGAIFCGEILFWVFFRYKWPYAKNRKDLKTGKDKTGLIVAIFAESYEGVKMKNKFIRELERQIIDAQLDGYFKIVSLSNHHAEKIRSINDIESIHSKVQGHIYFYGDVQKEKAGKDKKKYFLNIDGYVKHLPIPIPVSQELSFDFRTVLPKEISFDDFFELHGCKATAKIVYLTTKYVVGVASFLSGNPFLAYEMHKNLVNELSEYKKIQSDRNLSGLTNFDFKNLKKIENKLPLIIANEAAVISRVYYLNKMYDEARKFLRVALLNNPNSYDNFLLKAIFDFQLDNNPLVSFESIKIAKKLSKNRFEWRYSWAFLKFWNEEYKEAYKMCQKISRQYYDQEFITLNEVEAFNLEILSRINKPQLYFWIGYLNYKKSGNLPSALSYFEKFIRSTDGKTAEFLVCKANTFLNEIKKEMNLNSIQ